MTRTMPTPLFIHVDNDNPGAARDSMHRVEAEYLAWVRSEISKCFPALATRGDLLHRPDGDAHVPQALCAWHAQGTMLYLIEVDGEPAGMCGLRSLASGTAEIKRLYVRPAYRGMQLGSLALRRLLADAHQRGYARICLDTAHFMKAAQAVYEAHGFTDCAAYEGTEVPVAMRSRWRFMQRAVTLSCP